MHGAGTLPQLTVPRFHQGYLVPIESLPDTFQADLAAFCRHLAGADPLAENGPPRPLRPISVYRRRFQVLQLASGLITRGRPAETMRTLADLVMPDTLREALLFFLDRSGGRTTTQISQLAYTALMIAKHWASADAATIAAIKKLNSRVACDNRGMTEKNAGRLRQFEDPENLRRLLLLPEELFAELRHRGDRSRAACVQARSALAVAILLAAPIRLGNLVALRLGIHLLSSRGTGGAWHLVIPADETKNTRALEFALPAYVVALLRQYLERYRPLVAPPGSDYLFPSPTGGHLATDNLGPRISRFVRQRTGLEVNPHLFRHLAAKLVLEDTPGGYGIAQDILGHKSPKTTRNFYAGTETAASLRLFERIVLRKRAKLP